MKIMDHEIQISEPWDFEHPLGSNILKARGLGIIPGPDQPNWGKRFYLVELKDPFEFDGELVKQMICSPRYEGDTIEKITTGECTVGIARVKPGCELNASSTVDPDKVVYCAIGSIKITQQKNVADR